MSETRSRLCWVWYYRLWLMTRWWCPIACISGDVTSMHNIRPTFSSAYLGHKPSLLFSKLLPLLPQRIITEPLQLGLTLRLKITVFCKVTLYTLVDFGGTWCLHFQDRREAKVHGLTSQKYSSLHSHCHENLESYAVKRLI